MSPVSPVIQKRTMMTDVTMSLLALASDGIEHALGEISRRYGRDCNPGQSCEFSFVAGQTIGTFLRAGKLAEAMVLSGPEVSLVRLAAAFSSIAQVWEEDRMPDGEIFCIIDFVKSKQASVDELEQWLRGKNPKGLGGSQKALLREAIMATVVDVDSGGALFQPNLQDDSHPVVLAVALADLGSAGMDGAGFVFDAKPKFRDANIDILNAIKKANLQKEIPAELRNSNGGNGFKSDCSQGKHEASISAIRKWNKQKEIPPQKQKEYKERIFSYLEDLIEYVDSRRMRLEVELGDLGDKQKAQVRPLFCGFEDAKQSVVEFFEFCQDKDFWHIAKAMRYRVLKTWEPA